MSYDLIFDDEPIVDLLSEEIDYQGELHDRAALDALVDDYHKRHESDLMSLKDLRKAHDEIAAEMTRDLVETNTVWDHVKGMVTDDFALNFRGILEKLPILNDFVADRPLSEILRQKMEIAEQRTGDLGQFLTSIERSVNDLKADITRLNKKVVIASENGEKSATRVLELKTALAKLEEEILSHVDTKTPAYHKLKSAIDELRQAIWEQGARLRLYAGAEDRISSIVKMNNNFLEILIHLHTDMQLLHEAGLTVLDELRGNLSGLAIATEAGEISLDMQKAMGELKDSVNKVAILASNTALYLSANVDRMASEMKLYDDSTRQIIENNLQAEREIRENRINETIDMAQREYDLMKKVRSSDP